MKAEWVLAALLAGSGSLLACAQSVASSRGGEGGEGGEDDQQSSQGGPTTSQSTGSQGQGGQGGQSGDCGNGEIDPGELCDGSSLGGQDCQTLGLPAGGLLKCTAACGFDASGCIKGAGTEVSCSDSFDNDSDGFIDCKDPDCAASCAGGCAAPQNLPVPSTVNGSTQGQQNMGAPTCSFGNGPEAVYQFVAPATGTVVFSLQSFSNLSISVRTSCTSAFSEVNCSDFTCCGDPETLFADVSQGSTYYVIVDSYEQFEAGPFSLTVDFAKPESSCGNLTDDDFDGLVDCEDPSDCQGISPDCKAGPNPVGSACTASNECVADAGDPICFSEALLGFPGGYCSEFCDAGFGVCTGDATCMPVGFGSSWQCLANCSTSSDCRPGYACQDLGFGQTVCYIGPPPEVDCDNLTDDDLDGLVDCEDPSDCQTFFDCQSGFGVVGDPCFSPSDCSANMTDPLCLSESYTGYLGGYCSEFCDLVNDDCSGDAICVDMGYSAVNGICMDTCASDADCRMGYVCADMGFAQTICTMGPESICDNMADDDGDNLIDCQDPTSCKTSGACDPGSLATGSACVKPSDCSANDKDPVCFDEFQFSYPDGYCSEFCDLVNDDCGGDALCADNGLPNGVGLCVDTCVSNMDCRMGYACQDFGLIKLICLPI